MSRSDSRQAQARDGFLKLRKAGMEIRIYHSTLAFILVSVRSQGMLLDNANTVPFRDKSPMSPTPYCIHANH